MRRLLATLVLCAVAASAGAIDTGARFADPAMQARYERLVRELRCMQCQNNSLADSPGGLAADLRREVRELMQEGKSDKEIQRFMTERYGDFILYRPPFAPRTWLLWFAPLLLVLGGGYIAFRIVSARTALLDNDPGEIEEEEAETR